MSENVAEAVQPTYEQIVGGIRHKGVQELLQGAEVDQRALSRELEAVEANEDLNDEAKERRTQELVERFEPKINGRYREAKAKVETSAESSYKFSLPFPDGKTYAQAQVKDTAEMLAVQGEAEAIAKKIAGTSLQEATKAVSQNPRDKGIREASNHTMQSLREEFDLAMAAGGVEGRVRAMAIERVCSQMGVDLEEVVAHRRTAVHRRAREDYEHFSRAAGVLPSGKTSPANPFGGKRQGGKAVGTYSSESKPVMGNGRPRLFQKKQRKPLWK
jgi:hypothetical protein